MSSQFALGESSSWRRDTYKPLIENPTRSVWTNYTDEIMNAAMKVLSGSLSGQSVRIPRKLLIGRAEDCDLRLASDFVSNYHCMLLLDEYTLQLRDLGSKNGTLVNGCRVGTSAIILLHNDTVSIGEVTLLIDLTPEVPEPIGSRPEAESSSTRSDGGVFLDGAIERFSPAPDPVDPPLQKEDGNG